MKGCVLYFLGFTILTAVFTHQVSADRSSGKMLAQSSVDCSEGRQIMDAMSQHYGPITDTASCRSACIQRGEPANSACYAICNQCYQEKRSNSTGEENGDSDIFPAATATERKLIRYLIKNGEKNSNELGNSYTLKLSKQTRKKMKFSGLIRSTRWEKACAVKLDEADGTPMSGLNVVMSGKAAEKKCRKLKSGDKFAVIPATLSYTFIPKNPFTGKSNVGMLFVTTP